MISTRRSVIGGAVACGASLLGAPALLGQAKPRAIVIGGGAGGAIAAKYIARDSAGAIDVTLIEPLRQYQSCFHSNLYLGGFRDHASITHGYDGLATYGVTLIHQFAATIDRTRKRVILSNGVELAYDRLVVSPGVDLRYDSVPGWSKATEQDMPHAWKPGEQTQLLKAKLDATPNGGMIVIVAPPNPYRCPPGPYERASMMAHLLKATNRGDCKIFIVDPKESFSKQALFQEGWEKYYPGMIEWIGPKVHDGLKSVDPTTNTVVTGFESYRRAALVNVIPAQMAGAIARDAGLANQSGYCPINPDNMKSTMDSNIHVLGDACIAGDMPKSAFAANSQAKVAAMRIRNELTGARMFPARYANACWSLIETDDAVKVGGQYAPKDGKIAAVETFVSQMDESPDLRRQAQAENMAWYAGVIADMFS